MFGSMLLSDFVTLTHLTHQHEKFLILRYFLDRYTMQKYIMRCIFTEKFPEFNVILGDSSGKHEYIRNCSQ